jgi:flavin-dependent dehydrogenase
MTFVPSTAATSGAIAASAAAKRRRELQREEELMTKYGADEIEGWEFKIVRSATRKFKDSEFLRTTCNEEARSGWEMLEKFDDYRVRFRRKTEHRDGDLHREIDPYRTQVGMSSDRLGLLIAVSALLGTGVLVAVIAFIAAHAK